MRKDFLSSKSTEEKCPQKATIYQFVTVSHFNPLEEEIPSWEP